MLTIIWAFVIVMSEITDHHNEHNGDEKVWHIKRITKMWDRDLKWANAIGKMAPIVFPFRVATNLQFVLKKNKTELSVKHNKSENAVKQGMPLFIIWQSGSFATKSQAVFSASSSTTSSLSIYFSHRLVTGCQTCYALYTAIPFPLREMPYISPTKVLPFITSFCLYNGIL